MSGAAPLVGRRPWHHRPAMAKHAPPPAPPGPFNAALSGLAARLGEVPRAPAPPDPVPPKPTGPPPPARAVVRMERAGRGGKTVTVVEKLELRPRELEAWLGELKRALGCGGVVERGALVLQGDTRERVGAWLEKRGVRKVTVA
jgi:translation initiation factor 1